MLNEPLQCQVLCETHKLVTLLTWPSLIEVRNKNIEFRMNYMKLNPWDFIWKDKINNSKFFLALG